MNFCSGVENSRYLFQVMQTPDSSRGNNGTKTRSSGKSPGSRASNRIQSLRTSGYKLSSVVYVIPIGRARWLSWIQPDSLFLKSGLSGTARRIERKSSTRNRSLTSGEFRRIKTPHGFFFGQCEIVVRLQIAWFDEGGERQLVSTHSRMDAGVWQRQQFDLDFWIAAHKVLQGGFEKRKRLLSQTEAQHAVEFLVVVLKFLQDIFGHGVDLFRPHQKSLSPIGQDDGSRLALEKFAAKLLFQQTDLLAEGRLGNVQALRGFRERFFCATSRK